MPISRPAHTVPRPMFLPLQKAEERGKGYRKGEVRVYVSPTPLVLVLALVPRGLFLQRNGELCVLSWQTDRLMREALLAYYWGWTDDAIDLMVQVAEVEERWSNVLSQAAEKEVESLGETEELVKLTDKEYRKAIKKERRRHGNGCC